MSRIQGKDTTPELQVRKFLFNKGFRYRIHYRALPGKPDIVFVSRKIIIEIKGCYWHRHKGCKYASTPKTNAEFYKKKFQGTVARDKRNKKAWLKSGWKVIEIWECELKTAEKREARLKRLLKEI